MDMLEGVEPNRRALHLKTSSMVPTLVFQGAVAFLAKM
jgi:hypothetical protein